MRTTITIDDQILEQLKKRAAHEGTTVSRLIEDSVRVAWGAKRKVVGKQSFRLVTFGKGGHFTSLNVDRTSELIEMDDVARHARRR